MQQHIEVTKLLRSDSGFLDGDVPLPATCELAALEWHQELGVESGVIVKAVVRDGRCVLAEVCAAEASPSECFGDVSCQRGMNGQR